MIPESEKKIVTKVEILKSLNDTDLADLCNITEQAIGAGGGFGWLKSPPRDNLNKFWRGVVMIPNRKLFVKNWKYKKSKNRKSLNEASSNHFVTKWSS